MKLTSDVGVTSDIIASDILYLFRHVSAYVFVCLYVCHVMSCNVMSCNVM